MEEDLWVGGMRRMGERGWKGEENEDESWVHGLKSRGLGRGTGSAGEEDGALGSLQHRQDHLRAPESRAVRSNHVTSNTSLAMSRAVSDQSRTPTPYTLHPSPSTCNPKP
eukprot:2769862-Rhodomonas_salina.3